MRVLVIDVGGTHVKALATGHKKPVKILSGLHMTAAKIVAAVRAATGSCGHIMPSRSVTRGRWSTALPLMEPYHLGRGWLGFHFTKAFARPVKIVNDAAMQALGSYQGGRMLFLGLRTGLGSTHERFIHEAKTT